MWYAGRVTGYKIFASGKGAVDKAHISVKYDDGEHMWHEIGQTEIKHAARSKTLVVDGERGQTLTSVEEEEDTLHKMSEENEMAGVTHASRSFMANFWPVSSKHQNTWKTSSEQS